MGRFSVNGAKVNGVLNSVLGLSWDENFPFSPIEIPENRKNMKPPIRRIRYHRDWRILIFASFRSAYYESEHLITLLVIFSINSVTDFRFP
jgi:hypothetical protein